jgi:hypothetical protein
MEWNLEPDHKYYLGEIINLVEGHFPFPTAGSVTIEADIINIDGVNKIPSIHLHLIARLIVCGKNSKIITSGNYGARYATPANFNSGFKPNGRDGKDGSDGLNGGHGDHAGNVTINCETLKGFLQIEAKGGSGGYGQDGAAGANGKPGAHGTDDRCEGIRRRPGREPESGGKGGNGGRGGNGGNGGKGGNITINAIKVENTPILDTSAGKEGFPGKGGDPGEGSPGGRGGKRAELREERPIGPHQVK